MARIQPGRMTHRHEGSLVVFHIGMTINKWHRPDQWWPVFAAMPGMLAELSKDPDSGLLGYRLLFGRRGPTVIQYWESTELLLRYARDRSSEHFPAWAAFNRRIGKNGDVGIWHETYVVPRGAFENIYVNMPRFGLGAFSSLEAAHGKRARGRDRALGAEPAGGLVPAGVEQGPDRLRHRGVVALGERGVLETLLGPPG